MIIVRHNDVVLLLSKKVEYDELGNAIETVKERMVYANEMSVSMQEFYEAGKQGIRPEKQFEIYTYEYAGESQLKHNGLIYNIIRAQSKGDKTRIVCKKVN